MNVLVTGAAGYIGSHCIRRLLNEGHRVVALDSLEHGFKRAIDKRAHFVQAAVQESETVRAVLRDNEIEAVIHFAAWIEVGESVQNPFKYYQNNFAHGLAFLESLRIEKVSKLIFSSTAAVYGEPQQTPIDENHPKNPVNPYGRSKWMMEQALADASSAYGLKYIPLRYFNVAGAASDATLGEAHEPETHLVPRILQVPLGKASSISVFGTDYETRDGTCVRDFIHVEDLVEAHLLSLNHIHKFGGEPFNIGTETGFTVKEVISACERVVGKNIPIKLEPRRAGDPPSLVASNSKIKKCLGWNPKFLKLETIVEHAWAWHKSHPLGYASI